MKSVMIFIAVVFVTGLIVINKLSADPAEGQPKKQIENNNAYMNVENALYNIGGEVTASKIDNFMLVLMNNSAKQDVELFNENCLADCTGDRDDVFDTVYPELEKFMGDKVEVKRLNVSNSMSHEDCIEIDYALVSKSGTTKLSFHYNKNGDYQIKCIKVSESEPGIVVHNASE